MFNRMHSHIKRIVSLTAVITCLALSACSMEKTSEVTEDADQYDQTVTHSFSKDNVLALTSVRLDGGGQGNRIVLEFDASSEYVTKEALKTALESMDKKPTSYFWGIEGESADQVKSLEAKVTEKKDTIYVSLFFDPKIECSHVEIKLGNRFVNLDGPWEAPDLQVVDYTHVQDGAEGVLYRTQEYDDTEQSWKECRDSFHENQDPVAD